MLSLILLCLLIFAASFVLTMVGLGGGLVFSPLFILLKFPVHTALAASLFLNGIAAISAATSIFVVIFSSFSGFIAHVSISRPDWPFLLTAALFSFAGGQLGSRLMADKLQGKTVRRIFGGILLIFVIKLLQKSFT